VFAAEQEVAAAKISARNCVMEASRIEKELGYQAQTQKNLDDLSLRLDTDCLRLEDRLDELGVQERDVDQVTLQLQAEELLQAEEILRLQDFSVAKEQESTALMKKVRICAVLRLVDTCIVSRYILCCSS